MVPHLMKSFDEVADVDEDMVDVVAEPGGSRCSNAVKAGEAIVNFS